VADEAFKYYNTFKVKPRRPMLWNRSSSASFFCRQQSFILTHGQLRKPQHNIRTSCVQSVKRTLSWIGHSRSFQIILVGAGRNPERCVVVMRNWCRRYFWNVRKMATGKRQIRRFQRPHSGLTTLRQKTPSNIYKRFILPETRLIDLYFCRW